MKEFKTKIFLISLLISATSLASCSLFKTSEKYYDFQHYPARYPYQKYSYGDTPPENFDSIFYLSLPMIKLNETFYLHDINGVKNTIFKADSFFKKFTNINEVWFDSPVNNKSHKTTLGGDTSYRKYIIKSATVYANVLNRPSKINFAGFYIADTVYYALVDSTLKTNLNNNFTINNIFILTDCGTRYGESGFKFPTYFEKFKNVKTLQLKAPCLQNISPIPSTLSTIDTALLEVDSLNNVIDFLAGMKNLKHAKIIVLAKNIPHSKDLPFDKEKYDIVRIKIYKGRKRRNSPKLLLYIITAKPIANPIQ